MSEISWIRERSAAMRASMDCHDFSDAIDVVLGHLANVETSRADALARVAELEGEVEDWKAGSEIEAREADKGRKRVAELERLHANVVEGLNERTGELAAERRRVAELERQIERRRLNDSHTPYCGGLDD